MASGGELAPPLCIYDPIVADITNILHPQVNEKERGCPEERGSTGLLARGSIITKLLPPAPASVPTAQISSISVDHCWLQFYSVPSEAVQSEGEGWGQQGEAQQLSTGRNSKLHREPETHCAVAKLTKAVQNVPKPVNILWQRWC